ncbi:MAG: tRNA 4-thiouridine(8) synthase ThiI [Calditrichaeota bacterium]|nr:MAG: tRNA 4-thiouridine(8) synthase ThiI [Calditrichota bacterium]
MQYNCFIIHYAEVALKRGNRPYFEKKLVKNIKSATKGCGPVEVDRRWGRILLMITSRTDVDGVIAALKTVFGIAYFAPGCIVDQEIDDIAAAALASIEGHSFETYKVATRRANKHFHMNSVEVNIHVADLIWEKTKAGVDLKNPDFTVFIEIFDDVALVFAHRVEGQGGLPVGVSSRAVLLLSSGIDSPVAGFRMMKRGVRMVFVHFHSAPYTSTASKKNAEKLVEILTKYQFNSTLYTIPFLEIQQHITSIVPGPYRVIMYRRAMYALAEKIADLSHCNALVSGENVAQVASQTLPNIRAIAEDVSLPIFRPLSSFDKKEIIAEARIIGTYETSIEPYEDCCTLFVPENPETRAKLPVVHELAAKLDLEPFYAQALENMEEKSFKFENTK